MGNLAAAVLYLAVMVVLIVGVDIAFFRGHVWPRLIANVGIVLVFAGFYLRFFKSPLAPWR